MIKALMHDKDDKPVYVLGLSDNNLRLLRERKPIKFDLMVLGGTGTVVIFWGETEESMHADLARNFQLPVKE